MRGSAIRFLPHSGACGARGITGWCAVLASPKGGWRRRQSRGPERVRSPATEWSWLSRVIISLHAGRANDEKLSVYEAHLCRFATGNRSRPGDRSWRGGTSASPGGPFQAGRHLGHAGTRAGAGWLAERPDDRAAHQGNPPTAAADDPDLLERVLPRLSPKGHLCLEQARPRTSGRAGDGRAADARAGDETAPALDRKSVE